MDADKEYLMLDRIPYASFEFIESIDVARETATVIVRDDSGHADYFELKLDEIPKKRLADYLKSREAGKRLLVERLKNVDKVINKLNEVLAE